MGKGARIFCAFPVFPVVFYKKGVLNNINNLNNQDSQKTLLPESFFIKVVSLTLLRRTPAQTVSEKMFAIF